jgi:pimeloyl-ACP methyl ester carboxylesterase
MAEAGVADTAEAAEQSGFAHLFVTAPDGLRLHARAYGERCRALPVVCLPGLTRNASDFHELASALAHDARQPRFVIAIDSRGRGRSEYDRNPENYSFPVELGAHQRLCRQIADAAQLRGRR